MQLGLPNWIIDDLKVDSNKFRQGLLEDSDSKVEIVLQLKDDVEIQLHKFKQFLTIFNLKVDKKIKKLSTR